MMYRVTMKQKVKYDETVVGCFDNFEAAMNFMKLAMEHFTNVVVSVEVIEEHEAKGDVE